MNRVALDTSAAVPYLMRAHVAHRRVDQALKGHSPVMTQHSLAETYSVLTRLPGDARVAPTDAARLLEETMGPAVGLKAATSRRLPRILADLGIAGGAVYDALVAIAAQEAGLPLFTRDLRARSTYQAIGVEVRSVVDETPPT